MKNYFHPQPRRLCSRRVLTFVALLIIVRLPVMGLAFESPGIDDHQEPQLVVFPSQLNFVTTTGANPTLTLTISNTSSESKTFMLQPVEYIFQAYLQISPSSGTIPAGGSVQVSLTLRTFELDAIEFSGVINLVSNVGDPVIAIPVSIAITANGSPILSIYSDELDFGSVPDGGSKNLPVTFRNFGSAISEVTGISFTDPAFSTTAGLPIAVFPQCWGNASILISFTPQHTGITLGDATITTTDPNHPAFTVHLSGSGTLRPELTASTDSIYKLVTGPTSTTINVANTSDGVLEFYVNAGVHAAPYGPTGQPYIPRLLVVTPDDYPDDVRYALSFFSDVDVTIFPKASLPSLTVGDLLSYDVVYVKNNFPWSNGGVSGAFMGDLLATYIDQGGKLVIEQSAFSSIDGKKLEGRFIDEQYGPLVQADSSTWVGCQGFRDPNNTLRPDHPLMMGGNFFAYTGLVSTVGVAPDAIQLGNWITGEVFAASKPNIFALNAILSIGDPGGGYLWDGSFQDFYHRAVYWFGGAPYLNVSSNRYTLDPGEEITLDIGIDPASLPNNRYEASLDFVSNDPNHEILSIPVVLDFQQNFNKPPVIKPVADWEVVAGEVPFIEVRATDPDDDYDDLEVFMVDPPPFVMEGSSGDSSLYAVWIVTEFLPAGDYDFVLVARDPHGASDSTSFRVTVRTHGIQYFEVVNTNTNQVIAVATGNIKPTIDVARPDFSSLAVRAVPWYTNQELIKSVTFYYDGKKKNVDNNVPFYLSQVPLATSGNGLHILGAQTYSRTSARGETGKEVSLPINLMNSASITSLEVVDRWGNHLMELAEGAEIDIGDPAFQYINIKANTTGYGVGRVSFLLNGKLTTDNSMPYALAGGTEGNFNRWAARPGSYTLAVTPKSNTFGNGVTGETKTINFTVTNGGQSALARTAHPETSGLDESEKFEVEVHPNPFTQKFIVYVETSSQRSVTVSLLDIVGRIAQHKEDLTNIPVEMESTLPAGVYILKVTVGPQTKMIRLVKSE